MQLEALKIFCDVARLHSFSRGAAENEVTQSTASQTLHQLEKHLGVTLIERSCRPLALTPEGKLFYEGCREIVHRYQDLETRVRRAQTAGNAVVRVAAIYSVGLGDMSACIERFNREHPPTHVEIEYLPPDRVYESVLNEAVDFGIVSFPRPRRDLTVIPWRLEPMVLACHPQHRLAGLARLPLGEIEGQKFVAFDEHLVIRREIDRFLKQHDVHVDVAMEFDNVEAIKRAVEVNSGVSILPQPTLDHEVSLGTLAAVPFGVRGFTRPLGLIHRRSKKLYASTLEFIELLRATAPAPGNGNGHGRHGKLLHSHETAR